LTVQSPEARDSRTDATEQQTDTALSYAADNPPENGSWQKTWNAESDCCDECADLDGTSIAADDQFNGELDGPPLHPNCRCEIELNEQYDASSSGGDTGDDSGPGFAEQLANQILGGGDDDEAAAEDTIAEDAGTHLTQDEISDGISSEEQLAETVSEKIGDAWNVSSDDLAALAREGGYGTQGMSDEELRKDVVFSLLRRWQGSSGGPEPVSMITHVADKLNLPYKLAAQEEKAQAFIKADPALERALGNLGDTMYADTQKWFADHDVTEVRLMRAASHGEEWDATRPWTSWSTGWGGLRHEPGVIYRDEVIPVERVFSIPATGFGTRAEAEVVVLPPPPESSGFASTLARQILNTSK